MGDLLVRVSCRRCPLLSTSGTTTLFLLGLALLLLTCLVDYTLGVSTYPCVPPCVCAKHNWTLSIDCRWRALTRLPVEIPRAAAYHLLMAGNRLRRLDDDDDRREYLGRVTHLDVSHNQLRDVQAAVVDALQSRIRVLLLHGNQMQHVPQQLALVAFSQLEMLTLHANPLLCDCRARWLKRWLRSAHHVPRRRDILCAGRRRWLRGRPVMDVPDAMFECHLHTLEEVGAALQHADGNPGVMLGVMVSAILFMWVALVVLYRNLKTSSEIKWVQGSKWTALTETE